MKDMIEKIIRDNIKIILADQFRDSPPAEQFVECCVEEIGAIIMKPVTSCASIHDTIKEMDAEEFQCLLLTAASAAEVNIDEASNANWLKIAYHLYEAVNTIKSRSGN